MSAASGKDSLRNVFETDAKDIVPRLSPDQNDTAVITGGLASIVLLFELISRLSYHLKTDIF